MKGGIYNDMYDLVKYMVSYSDEGNCAISIGCYNHLSDALVNHLKRVTFSFIPNIERVVAGSERVTVAKHFAL